MRGTSRYDADGKYHVTISFRRRKYNLGGYDRIEDAKAVRDEAERMIWGPAIESDVEVYPDHAECERIVADIRKRWTDAKIRRLTESY